MSENKTNDISSADISTLRDEASAHGDPATASLCTRALHGSRACLTRVQALIREERARAADTAE